MARFLPVSTSLNRQMAGVNRVVMRQNASIAQPERVQQVMTALVP
ncbi:MAG TPA: hypothetical protein VG754_14070 [Verrucomicrobiae bacterium]|nr:hypothetical protein [Verrucomicrobiae bacterium]